MKHNIQGQEHGILCEKKLETKLHFGDTWKYKYEMKETKLWCSIIL
jgi:hypothetical protein